MASKPVEKSVWIAAPRERVWQAIYEPEQVAQWFLPPALGAQLTRDDSGKLSVMMGPMSVDIAMLEQVDPPRQLTSRGLPDRLAAATYTLEEEGDGHAETAPVRLTGLEALPAAAEERLGPSGVGWEKALQNLKAFVEGNPLPFPEGVLTSAFGYRRESAARLSVERSIWINAPRERVWRAITDPKQVEQWFSPGTAWQMSALEPGGRLYVYDPETKTEKYTQVVDRVEPPSRYVTHSLAEGAAPSYVSDWTLAEENGGTRLTLTYSGYELEAADTRHNNMEQTGFGFGMMLDNLRAQVEGQSLPFPADFSGREARMVDTPVFAALAHPVRRSLMVNLAAHSPKTATQLAQEYPLTRQGVLKHLRILEEASLVTVYQKGREKRYSLTPAPLSEVDQWIDDISNIWDKRLLRLKAFIEDGPGEE